MASIWNIWQSDPTSQATGDSTVEKLRNRVTSATLVEDRRDALRALKGMSREYRKEVGELCLEILLEVIKNNKSDAESVAYAAEALLNVIGNERGEERTDQLSLGKEFAGILVRNPENISLLLDLMEEFDFQVRRITTRLLTALLINKLAETQEYILKSPMGVSKTMDLLSDSREVIRNDALLLIYQLTRSNSQIQKIVAFENAFERLMNIIDQEGYSDGGIIVEDCIAIMQNLLKGNSSNQAFFREASQIQLLVPFFHFKITSSMSWPKQKISNIVFMLSLVRTMVSPINSQHNISSCQKVIMQCDLLSLLCNFMFAGGVPTEILIETINTVAEVVRGCLVNQVYFNSVSTPSHPPRQGVLTILMCMVNEKQPLPLRLAALYCFLSYLYKNEDGQDKVIKTLLPSSTETSVSAGQVLCAGLFGSDPLSNWMTAIALAASLSSKLKPDLLRVQLSMQGKGQVTLLHQCSSILVESSDLKPLSRVGLLLLLCAWLVECPMAVNHFLSIQINVPFLTRVIQHHYDNEVDQLVGGLCAFLLGICLTYNDSSCESYPPETLRQVIAHHIGQETFVQSLLRISSSEAFTRAAKQPNPTCEFSKPNQVCFDYSFTVLFKQASDVILKALDPSTALALDKSSSPPNKSHSDGSFPINNTSFEEHTSVVQQYKELLQEQDQSIIALKQQCRQLEEKCRQLELSQELPTKQADIGADDSQSELSQLQGNITSLQRVQESLRQELASKNVQLEKLKHDLELAHQSTQNTDQLQSLKLERDQLKADNEALLTEKAQLDQQLVTMQSKQPALETLYNERQVQELQLRFDQLQVKNETLEKEQEDLLVLLADYDSKMKKYKSLLAQHDIQLPESDEEDFSDEIEDED